jgi:hypothetical protein
LCERRRLREDRSVGLSCFDGKEPGSLGWTDKNNPFIPVIRVLPSYTFDRNGNLLNTGVMTNTFDGPNRLVTAVRNGVTVQPIYNGVGDQVRQTISAATDLLYLGR